MLLRFVIQRRGGFIQNQNRRVFQEYPGNGNALLLATGKPGTALAHVGIIAILQAHDKVVDVGILRRFLDLLLGGILFSISDVLPDGSRKDIHILLDNADGLPQAFELQLANVVTVHQNAAAGDVIKSGQQGANGGFAAAGRANQCAGFSRRNLNVQMAEHLLLVRVLEGYVLVLNVAGDMLQLHRIGGLLDVRLRLHDLRKPLKACIALLEHLREVHELPDGGDENADIQGIYRKIIIAQAPPGNEKAARYQRHHIQHPLEKIAAAVENAHGHVALFLGLAIAPIGGPEVVLLPLLHRKGLDHTDSCQ